ncbi:winged helix-turn-helix transcriptional regulator [Rhizobiales bacterium]|uniref:MarR family winged helix-turn-helix transcriptional regulator n=1 Tax=Hongsoonwoonella zoysiae TaxID=2821844 RepID=UPI0015604489|nr:MarR family winged helix-turn-helix transcriptional regulator [Hongsoonwoonella zoysiae]NRG18035.1 winged helix-turn-helix transcriptional regulator [Hongsoonwoonella zoysiae]
MTTLTAGGERAWVGLILASRAALSRVEAALKEAGLPQLVWYDVLLELAREGEGRLRNKDLAGRMLLEKYNLSRLIDRMAAEGVVERVHDASDARGAAIQITRKGRELREMMWPVYRDAVAASFASRFQEEELKALSALLRRVL